jgi:phage host-nuclease inhibitor protein Gam
MQSVVALQKRTRLRRYAATPIDNGSKTSKNNTSTFVTSALHARRFGGPSVAVRGVDLVELTRSLAESQDF